MPPYRIPAATEHEVCFAVYYDLSDQIAKQYL